MVNSHSGYVSVFDLRSKDAASLQRIQQEMDALDRDAQYGWGHTIDFGAFTKHGVLGENFLNVVESLDRLGWLDADYTNKSIADVGSYTGGISAILAARNPTTLYAVDELPSHLAISEYVSQLLGFQNVKTVNSSVNGIGKHIPAASLDTVLLSGVLYHMSDMLLGIYELNLLLKVGGTLLIETNAVDDAKRSYANFGRYHGGMWWQPTSACLKEMCEFMGFTNVEVQFYQRGRCLVRAVKATENIPFRCGINWPFESRMDQKQSFTNELIMAPARQDRTMIVKRIRHIAHKILGR